MNLNEIKILNQLPKAEVERLCRLKAGGLASEYQYMVDMEQHQSRLQFEQTMKTIMTTDLSRYFVTVNKAIAK